ncbi:efflux RND transporter periplasmic adaptor subunit [Alteromonas sp. H39]|uniref:efflux RND transporter periplasmic adaptor subunit n=1 Tax=Alteromonas sp. H39 TaxID=3389876 RepID=UPI0039DF737E
MLLVTISRHITGVLCLVLFLHCAKISAQETLSVQVIEVSSEQVNEQITLSGEVNALLTSRLSIETDGLVRELFVDVGSHVTKGDKLLVLDDALAMQSVKETGAAVAAAQATFDDAERLFNEAQRLIDANHIAQTEFRTRQSRRDEARAMLDQATAQRDRQKEVLENHTLYAPFSGVISQKNVEVGEWHQTGSQVLQLVSSDNVRVDVRLPQEVYPRLQNVKQVVLLPDTAPDKRIDGEIATVVPVGTSAGRSFLVRLQPVAPEPELIPGTSARATIEFEVNQQAIVVPRDALLRQPDGNVSAFVVKNGKAERRKLKLGGSGDYGIEVLEGLQQGEQVVVRGNEVLSDGQAVKVKVVTEGELSQ